jgi:hypothetical protein
MDKYLKVKKVIEDNNCSLLTTFEDFENKINNVSSKSYQHIRIEFVGLCRHNSSAIFTNFYLKKTGLYCKKCVEENTTEILKINNKNTFETEYKSISYLIDNLNKYYQVERTPEGCKADIIIKLLDEKDDLWNPLQVKSITKSVHGLYSFNINSKYNNMILICICISENKIWIIPYNDINVKNKLNISINKSKYNKYLVSDNLYINKFIEKYSDNIKKESFKFWFTPGNILQRREQDYLVKRETFIPFLEYKYPEIQGTCVDFIINGKKVQEKVIGYRNDRQKLRCDLLRNGGSVNRQRTMKSYDKGDNDYYWLHSSIDNRFWIIPEDVLIREGYIIIDVKKKTKRVLTFNLEWLKLYEYNYDNIKQDIFSNIFK